MVGEDKGRVWIVEEYEGNNKEEGEEVEKGKV